MNELEFMGWFVMALLNTSDDLNTSIEDNTTLVLQPEEPAWKGEFNDSCIGACELVKYWSHRNHGMKTSKKSKTKSEPLPRERCGGIGERPCDFVPQEIEELPPQPVYDRKCLVSKPPKGEIIFCATVYEPVCGDDGRSYGNACGACTSGNVEYYHWGACET